MDTIFSHEFWKLKFWFYLHLIGKINTVCCTIKSRSDWSSLKCKAKHVRPKIAKHFCIKKLFESLSILNVIFYLQSLLLNTHSIVFRNFLAHWNSKYIFFFISAVYVYYFVLIKHADHCNTDIYLIVLMPILNALDTKHETKSISR